MPMTKARVVIGIKRILVSAVWLQIKRAMMGVRKKVIVL